MTRPHQADVGNCLHIRRLTTYRLHGISSRVKSTRRDGPGANKTNRKCYEMVIGLGQIWTDQDSEMDVRFDIWNMKSL
jgi:hypothetical protein